MTLNKTQLTEKDFLKVMKHLCDASNVFSLKKLTKEQELILCCICLLYDWTNNQQNK